MSNIAFYIDETMTDEGGWFVPALCTRDESGYHPTTYHLPGDYKSAKAWVDERNADLGLTREAALDIVATTFRA